MDKVLFEKALEMSDHNDQVRKVSLYSWTREFFNNNNVSYEVVEFLESYSFDRSIRFKHVYYNANINDMVDNNLSDENVKCVAERLLIIGSGLNGDLVVLNLDTLTVGYVFHDELWENEDVNPRDIFIDLNCSIGEFYYNSVTNENFPVDGHEAEEYKNCFK